jgi:hypothetical protein
MLVGKEMGWNSYKYKRVLRKGVRMFRVRASYEEGSEVDRLGNEIIILEIVFGIVQPYE